MKWRFPVVAGLLLTAACAPSFNDSIPPPPPTRASAPTTTLLDPSAVTLPAVGGQKVNSNIAVGPGGANLTGTVVGPTGPVPGATVRAERLVGDYFGSTEVQTNPDGTWSIPHVLGGRFRVRAWRAPDLALIAPQILYLGATESRPLSLQLTLYQGIVLTPHIAPEPPIIGQPANLAVQITNATVDAKGVVKADPLPSVQIQLSGAGQWAVGGTNPAITGADGVITWTVVCQYPGAQSLTAIVNATQSMPITVPACSLPPTTVPPSSTTVAPVPGATTTTVKTTTTVH